MGKDVIQSQLFWKLEWAVTPPSSGGASWELKMWFVIIPGGELEMVIPLIYWRILGCQMQKIPLSQQKCHLICKTSLFPLCLMNKSCVRDHNILVDIFEPRHRTEILNVPLASHKSRDRLIWTGEEKGEYTVKSCYRDLMGEVQPPVRNNWTKIWKFDLRSKVKTFCTHCLPTVDLLNSKHVNCPQMCMLCSTEIYHLFVDCDLPRTVKGC